METLYVDRRATALGFEHGAVVIRTSDGARRTVPLAPLQRIVVRGEATLSSRLLAELWRHDTGLLLLSGRYGEPTARLLGRPHGDVTRIRAQHAAYADDATRREIARVAVKAKVRAQVKLWESMLQQHPERALVLRRTLERLRPIDERLQAARTAVATLLGLEGAAAAAHFEALAAVLPPRLGFVGRKRRPPPDPVNVVLSLGYTLASAEAARQAQIAGLDPLLGFLHEPAPHRPALAADLIEVLRPFVDEVALDLFHEGTLRPEHFTREGEACRMGKAGRERFYLAWERRAPAFERLLRLQCRVLVLRLTAEEPA